MAILDQSFKDHVLSIAHSIHKLADTLLSCVIVYTVAVFTLKLTYK